MVRQSSKFRISSVQLRLCEGARPIPGYELKAKRGQGAYGVVWSADGPTGRVALKFMACKQKHMVVQELRTLMGLRDLIHPHLLRYEQIWCHAGYIIIAMELADSSLADLFDDYQDEVGAGITPDYLCLLLSDAAKGIDYLNAQHRRAGGSGRGMQHCDIKPSNLLLYHDRVKVADFGLANRMVVGQTRSLGGTPDYCAPEVFQGRVSAHTDQFALAVTYCQLRTGRLPFNDTPASLTGRCTRLAADLSMLTGAEQAIVARALHPSPLNRWSSCGEFMGQLTAALRAHGVVGCP